MNDFITISAKNPPFPDMDYDFLRKKGLKLIEKLAGKIWSDYNTHDPGITILELLSYAITDLGYRTNFDIKDIITNNPDSEEKPSKEFYTASEILPSNPVTVNDYRKLIIDIDGIKNVWLEIEKAPEVPFYADYGNLTLSYYPIVSGDQPIELKGLYSVLIEFNEDAQLADLNDNSLKKIMLFNGDEAATERLKGLEITVDMNFPYWDNLNINWESVENILKNIQSINFKINKQPQDVKVIIEQDSKTTYDIIALDLKTLESNDRLPILEQHIKSMINGSISSDPNDNLVLFYQKKIRKIKEIIKNVRDKLHEHRNLCEDFMVFRSLKVEEVAICGSIDIKPEANTERIQAEIYYRIEKFISPDIRFFSLDELLDSGKTPDKIFEGPLLEKGFITEEDLLLAQRRKAIHVSDIIKLIMDIEGIVAVRDIQLSNIPDITDSILSVTSARWCLKLSFDRFYTGRFSQELSRFTFYKNKIPIYGDLIKVAAFYTEIKIKNKQNYQSGNNRDIPIPEGEFKDIGKYYSILHHLPVTYGVGDFGLSQSATKEHKAKVKQLRAFLLFFEQLLANYFSQLAHVKDLFSMNTSVDRTYFSASLTDISDILVEPAKYKDDLNRIIESDDLFIDRRNRFLDHLMARFAEQFTDYALLMYTMVGNKSQKELIFDKLSFLNEYPEISRDRGRAFNYKNSSSIWNTTNVSGWEKRLCRLAGIKDYRRKSLTWLDADRLFEIYQDINGHWRFRLKDKQGKIIFVSEAYTTKYNCIKGTSYCKTNGIDKTNYKALASIDGNFYFILIAQNNKIIGNSPTFFTAEERDEAMKNMVRYCTPDGNIEGFHIVEHILLRPKYPGTTFLHVDLDNQCYCKGDEDPYSFRITVVLPGWTERFKDASFRNFFERTLRTEVPAHIMLRICWISQLQMYTFENSWHSWLVENAREIPDQILWSEKLKSLIQIMEQLNNIHPLATLYDCKEIPGQHPVTLDNTVLGQINTQDNE